MDASAAIISIEKLSITDFAQRENIAIETHRFYSTHPYLV